MNTNAAKKVFLFSFSILVTFNLHAQTQRKVVTTRSEIFEICNKIDSGQSSLQTGLVFCDKYSIERFFIRQKKERPIWPKYEPQKYSETPLRTFAGLCAMAKKYGFFNSVQYDTAFLHYDKKIVMQKRRKNIYSFMKFILFISPFIEHTKV